MNQTALISQHIVRLGTRSYTHLLEVLTLNEYSVGSLRKLNRDLDSFYEFLYVQCNSVTEADYKVFGEQLGSMLVTLKMLWRSCKKMPKSCGISDEAEKLKMNYSALYELNEDIKNYRIKAPKDKEWSALLSQASLALKREFYD